MSHFHKMESSHYHRGVLLSASPSPHPRMHTSLCVPHPAGPDLV